MNLLDHKTKLRYSAQKLHLRWQETQTQWSDAVARDFERDVLQALDQPLMGALRAIEQMSEILSRATHDCEE